MPLVIRWRDPGVCGSHCPPIIKGSHEVDVSATKTHTRRLGNQFLEERITLKFPSSMVSGVPIGGFDPESRNIRTPEPLCLTLLIPESTPES